MGSYKGEGNSTECRLKGREMKRLLKLQMKIRSLISTFFHLLYVIKAYRHNHPSKFWPAVYKRHEKTSDLLGKSSETFGNIRKKRVLVIGGGHNGLVAAAYIAKAKGDDVEVMVLERRHLVGGAAVTEELYPGFHFSRGAYLAGLMRPHIIRDLNLEAYGFKYLPRNPSSFTPTPLESPYHGKYLMLGNNATENYQSIAQFSVKDAEAFEKYEVWLSGVRELIQPFLDSSPIDFNIAFSPKAFLRKLRDFYSVLSAIIKHRKSVFAFYELLVGSAEQILGRWFESDILKATLATDAVIGSMTSPKQSGSAYVLLHHVMGESDGGKGVWSYMEGGMGAVSAAIARAATANGVSIHSSVTVQEILHKDGAVAGVLLSNGTFVPAEIVLSGCNPYHTFIELVKENEGNKILPEDFRRYISSADYSCGIFCLIHF